MDKAAIACVLVHLLGAPAFGQPATIQEAPAQSTTTELARSVAELGEMLDEQREVNRRQAEEIARLSRQLDAAVAAMGKGPVTPPFEPGVEQRLAALEDTVERLPELPEELVTTGEFPGSIAVPGTETSVRVGGQVRMTAVHTLGPLGTDDRFIASSIPVGSERAGEDARTTYTASPSRLNLDLRSPWRTGGLRAFVEGDFAGTDATVRLRHAFLQTPRWLFGQTWSTFSDPEVQPIDIDFEGENALSRFRQPLIRYTRPIQEELSLSIAIENPAPDLTSAVGVNLTPDLVARLRWEPGGAARSRTAQPAHVQAALLVRSLRGELPGGSDENVSTGAVGGTLSGILTPGWADADRFKFAAYGGRGIGRYITDLAAAGGQDAVYDAAAGRLRALDVAAVYVGYEHQWRPSVMSAFTYGEVFVDNDAVQVATALRRTRRGSVNVVWNPVPSSDLVLELLAGQRIDKDGQRGASSQFQAGWRFRF